MPTEHKVVVISKLRLLPQTILFYSHELKIITRKSMNTENFKWLRWSVIAVFLAVMLLSSLHQTEFVKGISPTINVLAIFTAVWLHGMKRYGLKNMLIFFLITWLISNSFEALSIQTGFPFGHYYYDQLPGPRLLQVPLIIMFAYFATGYSSWILSQILLRQYAQPLSEKNLFLSPLLAAFIMVIWDLCIDPLCSTVASLWIWPQGGAYYGVPLQNYFGWFMVVFIIYQSFALYLFKTASVTESWDSSFNSKSFWLEVVTIYAIQGLTQPMQYIGSQSHYAIYAAMALVSVFSMLFVALLAFLTVCDSQQLQ